MSETGATSSESGAVDGATKAAEQQPQEVVEKGGTPCPNCSPSVRCPTDFHIETPTCIVRLDGESEELRVADLDDFSGGTFTWKSSSPNVRLLGTRGRSVHVAGVKNLSKHRDAEKVEVTRTAPGCGPVTKTILVTVAKLTFSKSPLNAYGYDDMNGKERWFWPGKGFHYLCIKEEATSHVSVKIEGGAVGTDFDFECASGSAGRCVPAIPEGSASFELALKAGRSQSVQVLQAKAKGSQARIFAEIGIWVYKEKLVKVVIGKFAPAPGKGALKFPDADYASHAPAANDKLREAVVKYELHNLTTNNKCEEVAFSSGTDTLRYDIAVANGGADVNAIRDIMTGATKAKFPFTPNTADMIRVAVVRRMISFSRLKLDVKKNDTVITLVGKAFHSAGERPTLGLGDKSEVVTVISADKDKGLVTCSPLTKDHPAGSEFTFGAGAWSSDPIIIQEGEASETVAKWTILHEVGHRALDLTDIVDRTNFMHFDQSWTDYRLRYLPMKRQRDPSGVDIQWKDIPRG